MKGKIENLISEGYVGYNDFRQEIAVELLEELFDKEVFSFISFLRENYNTWDTTYGYDAYEMSSEFWLEKETEKTFTTEEIYKQWKVKK